MLPVVIIEEYSASIDASLGDMNGNAWDLETGLAGHWGMAIRRGCSPSLMAKSSLIIWLGTIVRVGLRCVNYLRPLFSPFLPRQPSYQGKDEMLKIHKQRVLLAASLLLTFTAALPVSAQVSASANTLAADSSRIRILPPVTSISAPPPDSGFYTTYDTYDSFANLAWTVCGSTQVNSGCYGIGYLGPFGHAGALIEGNESVSGGTVTRNLYVVDDADGGTGVKLYVYTKTDVVTSSGDTVTVNLTNTIALPLVGGANAKTYMAANDRYLYIGTNLGPSAVSVQKSTLAMWQFTEDFTNLSSITSDKYGYVTVTTGDGFVAFGPSDNFEEDGGGGEFMLNSTNGFSTANFTPTGSNANLAARMKIRFKKVAPQITTGN